MCMKKILSFIFIFTLIGCVNTADVLNSWIGQDEDELVSSWGIPTATYRLGNGSKLIEYKKLTGIYGQNHCTRTFTVSRAGRITNWRQTGLGC
jgi:hypothetical protein